MTDSTGTYEAEYGPFRYHRIDYETLQGVAFSVRVGWFKVGISFDYFPPGGDDD